MIKMNFNEQEINTIAKALGGIAYREAAPVIISIQRQIDAAQAAAAAAKEAATTTDANTGDTYTNTGVNNGHIGPPNPFVKPTRPRPAARAK